MNKHRAQIRTTSGNTYYVHITTMNTQDVLKFLTLNKFVEATEFTTEGYKTVFVSSSKIESVFIEKGE